MQEETTIERRCGTCVHFDDRVCHALIPEWVVIHYETGDEIMTPDKGTHCGIWRPQPIERNT